MKTLKLVLIGTGLILTVVTIKYRPAYQVTFAGNNLGYIENKEYLENEINFYMNDNSGNIAYREMTNLPEYELKLINREEDTKETEIMLAVENSIITTYKFYAVTAEGEQKAVVETAEKAQSIIDEVKAGLTEEVDLKLGVAEIYSKEYAITSEEDAKSVLNEIKNVKLAAVEKQKAEARKKQLAINKAKSVASTTKVAATGNISGMALSIPVNGSISSRFGSRSSSRSTIHTGLDISAHMGTGIRPIAPGTVSYAAPKGTYGNLVIINHGNGVESYYAHCNSLFVGVGQTVDTNTTIAGVGSTGNSTGPHLHLEIRVNGVPVNPQSYLYK